MTTTSSGYVLDARCGKSIADDIDIINTKLNSIVYCGRKWAGSTNTNIELEGSGYAYLIMIFHSGDLNNNGLYFYYPNESLIYALIGASNISWTCTNYTIKLTSSVGSPNISYIMIA